MNDETNTKNTNEVEEELLVLDDEKSLLLDHDYDGIKELNHPLPFWWVWLFILCVVYCIPYTYYYHFSDGPSLTQELKTDMEKVNALRAANQEKQGSFDLAAYNAYVGSEDAARSGAKTFKRRCRSCHGADGEGGIGPNLTDNFWVYGSGDPATIYKTIDKGVDANGMPAWGEFLEKEALFAVTAHILKMKGSNPENAKAPQGKEVK